MRIHIPNMLREMTEWVNEIAIKAILIHLQYLSGLSTYLSGSSAFLHSNNSSGAWYILHTSGSVAQ